jgi:hypothetical protein
MDQYFKSGITARNLLLHTFPMMLDGHQSRLLAENISTLELELRSIPYQDSFSSCHKSGYN